MRLSLPTRQGANPAAPSRAWAAVCLALVLACAGAEFLRWKPAAPNGDIPALPEPSMQQKVVLTESHSTLIPMPPDVPSAHASSMAPMADGSVIAFWWAGSRESGPDVKVYASRFHDGVWNQPWEVASRDTLGAALGFGVRRIGNPVAWAGDDGKLHLYVVTTGLGGWAASRVVQMESGDMGRNFRVSRVLPMSPLFNTSVLVRTAPVALAGGGWWLPLYFELGIKYPKMLSFDKDGNPRRFTRIGDRTASLQPTIVPFSGTEVHALMRDSSDEQRVQHARSSDGGESWRDMPSIDLPNQSTSIAALRLSNGSVVMLHNHVVPGGSDRNMLRLSITKDARNWTYVTDVVHGKAGEEFSYPDMQLVGDKLHITYTSRRMAIAHHIYDIQFEDTL
jgi:predicted neuraminidase